MLLVGLTGGIGAGKSTVARLLAERGAVVIDADALARAALEPGTEPYARVVDRFGETIVRADGSIDRARLAALVFADDAAREALNAIVHPAVGRAIAARLGELSGGDDVVVLDVPLLVETGGADGVDLVLVVTADDEIRVRRLVEQRGMREEDVRARMAAQASQAEREARADVVLRNDGSEAELRAQVDEVWKLIEAERSARA